MKVATHFPKWRHLVILRSFHSKAATSTVLYAEGKRPEQWDIYATADNSQEGISDGIRRLVVSTNMKCIPIIKLRISIFVKTRLLPLHNPRCEATGNHRAEIKVSADRGDKCIRRKRPLAAVAGLWVCPVTARSKVWSVQQIHVWLRQFLHSRLCILVYSWPQSSLLIGINCWDQIKSQSYCLK